MIQVLKAPERPRSAIESFVEGISAGLPGAVDKYFSNQKQEQQDLQRNEAIKKLTGLDMSGLPPEMQQAYIGEMLKQSGQQEMQSLKGQAQSSKMQGEQFQDEKSYGKIKETFGEKFADLWSASPVGGRTELLKQGVDAKLRGQNIDQLLEGVQIPAPQIATSEEEAQIPQMKNGQLPKGFEWPDFTKRPAGYTPKDWVNERKEWRKENADVFLQNKSSLQSDKRDALEYNKLDDLNKKLPQGIDKWIINPQTGEPYGLAQLTGNVPPEVQEWVKIIARFQNRAKDAFGSRVTNFDLQSYMKQFPGLLNTKEGRDRIIGMLKINNKLDSMYKNSLDKVYKKYGTGGIPMEKADELAQSLIQEETDKLTNEYLSLDDANQMSSDEGGVEKNQVQVLDESGNVVGTIDASQVEDLPPGYRIQ